MTSTGKSCQGRGRSQGKEHGFILTFSDAAPTLWATETPPEAAQFQGQRTDGETEVLSGQGAPLSLQDGERQNQVRLTLMSGQSRLEAGAAPLPRPTWAQTPARSPGNLQAPPACLAPLQSGVPTISPVSRSGMLGGAPWGALKRRSVSGDFPVHG